MQKMYKKYIKRYVFFFLCAQKHATEHILGLRCKNLTNVTQSFLDECLAAIRIVYVLFSLYRFSWIYAGGHGNGSRGLEVPSLPLCFLVSLPLWHRGSLCLLYDIVSSNLLTSVSV